MFAFGNLIASRSDAVIAGDGFYAKPAFALPVSSSFAFDLDRQEDVAMAEASIAAGLVNLSHLDQSR